MLAAVKIAASPAQQAATHRKSALAAASGAPLQSGGSSAKEHKHAWSSSCWRASLHCSTVAASLPGWARHSRLLCQPTKKPQEQSKATEALDPRPVRPMPATLAATTKAPHRQTTWTCPKMMGVQSAMTAAMPHMLVILTCLTVRAKVLSAMTAAAKKKGSLHGGR